MNLDDAHIVEIGIVALLHGCNHPKYLNLCGRLSILESAEVLRRAVLFIGIDSGPAHLANAVGIYGVILMGNYLGFERYNPFSGGYKDGSNASIIYSQGLVSEIPVEQVLQVVMSSPSLRSSTR
jgi:ADP-heptose:LPS heptosyltransferase